MENKRDRILKAARNVFLRRGFDAARMDEVARRARIAKGTLYLYFKDKVDLYAAQLEERIALLTRGLMQIAASDDSPVNKLMSIVRHNLDYIAHQYHGSHFILDTQADQNPEDLRVIRQCITPRLKQAMTSLPR